MKHHTLGEIGPMPSNPLTVAQAREAVEDARSWLVVAVSCGGCNAQDELPNDQRIAIEDFESAVRAECRAEAVHPDTVRLTATAVPMPRDVARIVDKLDGAMSAHQTREGEK